MINTYEQFKDTVIKTIVFRAKNFAVTDCDIENLIDVVFADISDNVNMAWEKYEHIVDGSIETFTIPVTNINPEDTERIITRVYKPVLDIVDGDDNDMSKLIILTDNDEYRFHNDSARRYLDGKSLYFVRAYSPSIETLDVEMYSMILPVVIEGLMFHIQASIPDTIDGKAIGYQQSRYHVAKSTLINKLPQIQYVPKTVLRNY